jgi:hypothetical protein
MVEVQTMSPDDRASEPSHASGANSASRQRTCIGCGAIVDGADTVDTIRVILGPDVIEGPREIAIDLARGGVASGGVASGGVAGRSPAGRGATLHPTPKCVTGAAQKGLARSFKCALSLDGAPVTPAALATAIIAAMDRRIAALLGAAVRSKNAAIGSEPVRALLGRNEARSNPTVLVVVASDAEAARDSTEVRRAIAEGNAVAWSDKRGLAKAVQASTRNEGVGVVAIADRNLVRAVRAAVQQADGLRSIFGAAERGHGFVVASGAERPAHEPRARKSKAGPGGVSA